MAPTVGGQSTEEYLTVLLAKKRGNSKAFTDQVTEMQELAGSLPDGWDVADIAITDKNAKVIQRHPNFQKV